MSPINVARWSVGKQGDSGIWGPLAMGLTAECVEWLKGWFTKFFSPLCELLPGSQPWSTAFQLPAKMRKIWEQSLGWKALGGWPGRPAAIKTLCLDSHNRSWVGGAGLGRLLALCPQWDARQRQPGLGAVYASWPLCSAPASAPAQPLTCLHKTRCMWRAQLCSLACLLAVWPWVSYSTFLSLSSFTYTKKEGDKYQ